jgi:hypothetical protein
MSETDAPVGIIGNTLFSFSTHTSKKYESLHAIIFSIAAVKFSLFVTFCPSI